MSDPREGHVDRDADGWTTVESPAMRLRFRAPVDWRVRSIQTGSISVVAPERDTNIYRSNLTVAVSPVDGEVAEFGGRHLEDLERMLTDFQLLEIGHGMVGSFDGVRLTGTFRQGVYDLTLDQWLGLASAGVLTATAIAGNFDYTGEVATFEKIVASVDVA